MTSDINIEHEAEEAARRIEEMDVDALEWRDASALRAIAEADEGVQAAKDRLTLAVEAARTEGFSWTAISTVLGVSRQAARERFGVRPRTR